MKLIPLAKDYESNYRDFVLDFESAGEQRHVSDIREMGFGVYLARREHESRGEDLPEGIVPMSTYWLVGDEGTIHGELRLRHRLTPWLEREGGHIGYQVRPSSRRQGLGTEMLRQGLVEARGLGLDRVLITCDEDNLGSIRVIEANGGKAYESALSDHYGVKIRRYWILLE